MSRDAESPRSPEDVMASMPAELQACSNWGRWGPDDERGTLNFIDAHKVIDGVHLVSEGLVVAIGKPLTTESRAGLSGNFRHRMLYVGHDRPDSALDEVTIASHGLSVTHLDALGHMNHDGWQYNGRLAVTAVTSNGLVTGHIAETGAGIVTRGVLLDIARARGVPWLSPDDGILVADLEAAEFHARMRVRRGDALIVRTGLGARERAQGPEDSTRRAGLEPECLPWLHEREVAVYTGDCIERIPQPAGALIEPLHSIGLVAMGLAMIDAPDVEELADTCERLGRYEFLFMCAPLKLGQATGSPVEPLCIF